MMLDFPQLEGSFFVEFPFSWYSHNSLLPEVKRITKGWAEEDVVRFILAFTGKGFKYKEDRKVFGGNKFFIAEETLYHEYSDCEDRAILFFQICKETLGLPMLLLEYKDHLNVAVALKKGYGKPIMYKGRAFTVCEPTGSFEPQLGYTTYEGKLYEIFYEYFGEEEDGHHE